ncbi:GEVED domain-containing protein [Mesonia sp. MT50]|uniref:GEVED domain-containing protein n=1 Tax=Mesonia profundi TaxID=3070998 RepID=A0ABU0ZXT0_9FLAO|nr:GEVED domain-containing protein [Mesonia profundi]MDQ7916261.1 GEVED domain-containing protein [Mesonia profundi]
MKKIILLCVATLAATLMWTPGHAQVYGETCDGPITVSSLPFNDAGNTSTYGDDYESGDVPALTPDAVGDPYENYLGGDDVVYAYTPTQNQLIDISVTNHGTYTGVFVMTGCPFTSTVGGHTLTSGTAALEVNGLPVQTGETYYIVISTWADPQSTDYVIDIVDATPACTPPQNLSVSVNGPNNAGLSWEEPITGEPDGYLAKLVEGDSTEPTSGFYTMASDNLGFGYTGGLTPNTDYYYWIKSDCGSEESSLAMIYFKTTCATVSDFSEDFEATTGSDLPNCWTKVGAAGSVKTQASTGISGARVLYMYDGATVALPSVDNAAANTHQISMNVRANFTAGETIEFGYLLDSSDETSFVLISSIETDSSTTPQEFLATPTGMPAGDVVFALHTVGAVSVLIDDVSWELAPACPKVTGLIANNIGTTTVDLDWDTDTSSMDWDVFVVEHDETNPTLPSGSGTDPSVGSHPYTKTGLSPNTTYDFYVRADCDMYVADWTGPVTFTTACGAITAMFEDFDSYGTGSIVPDCWERMVPAVSAGSQSISSTSPASGTRNIYQYTSATSTSVIVALPEFSNIDAGTHWLKFKARVGSGTGTLSVGYVTDVSDYDSFILIEDVAINNSTYASNSEYSVIVPNTVPAGARLAIKSANNATSHYWDDVSWEQVPSCIAPTALVATGVAETTADIDWTAGASESSWNISWGTPGYTPGDAEEIATDVAAVTNYQITGLTAETAYDVYVQADCNLDGTSDWVGPLDVYTGYCIPTNSGDDAYIESVTITGDSSQDISNLNSGAGLTGTGYSDFSAQTVMVSPEGDIDYSVTMESGETAGLKIWIDWNNDLMFDETTEVVFESSSYSADYTGAITMPAGATGSHRMRIGSSYTPSSGPANACSHTGEGEYEDYTIDIIVLATCTEAVAGTVLGNTTMEVCALAPFSMSVTGNSEPADGLTRTWQSSPAGAGTWTDLGVAASTLNVAGIDTATDYRYHVECINGDIDDSAVIAVSLNPNPSDCYCIPEGTNSGRYIDNFATTGGAQNISNMGSGYSADGYGDFTTMTVEANAGDELSFTADIIGGTAGFRIWVDWNQDGLFDTTEEVAYSSSGYSAAHAGDFTIPLSAATGETRMRIVSHWLSTSGDVDPCETGFTNGEFEDYTIDITPFSGFIYEAGAWSPSDPNTNATASDNIVVIDGEASFTGDIEVNNITVNSGATLNVESVLTINGDITNNGDMIFKSAATSDGELAAVPASSSITGEFTVERYTSANRAYRFVSSPVTTSTSIHANWQEGATSATDNPAPGFGTHITGSTTDQQNGFDGTVTGNPSLFTLDAANQDFAAVANTDVNTITAGEGYLLFVRGDRSIDLTTNASAGETTLRSRGTLHIGDLTQTSNLSSVANEFNLIANPYQSAIDITSVIANSQNLNANYCYVYDPSLGVNGAYVTVDLSDGSNGASSQANQYVQPGQAVQVATDSNGTTSVLFSEADKAPGNHTSTFRAESLVNANGFIKTQLYTTENYVAGAKLHDNFMIHFSSAYNNVLNSEDAVKAFNFTENMGTGSLGAVYSIERRKMPVDAEEIQLFTDNYEHQGYTLLVETGNLGEAKAYFVDSFTEEEVALVEGENLINFNVDLDSEQSKATDRFYLRFEEQGLFTDSSVLDHSLQLYPNPTTIESGFYLSSSLWKDQQVSISVRDLLGREVYSSQEIFTNGKIHVSPGNSLGNGTYFVEVKQGDQRIVKRFITK